MYATLVKVKDEEKVFWRTLSRDHELHMLGLGCAQAGVLEG